MDYDKKQSALHRFYSKRKTKIYLVRTLQGKNNNVDENRVQRIFPYEVGKNPLRIGFSQRKPVFESYVVVIFSRVKHISRKFSDFNPNY